MKKLNLKNIADDLKFFIGCVIKFLFSLKKELPITGLGLFCFNIYFTIIFLLRWLFLYSLNEFELSHPQIGIQTLNLFLILNGDL